MNSEQAAEILLILRALTEQSQLQDRQIADNRQLIRENAVQIANNTTNIQLLVRATAEQGVFIRQVAENVQSLTQTVQTVAESVAEMQQEVRTMQQEVRTMQQEVRGLQTENRRILDILLRQQDQS
ncbi:MAG: hypothetical protein VKJ46_16925 [Leptolyngbyaceae bacterium]|nr:hypothetical protein [Leptolyngbyaceae bacterium]